jgi:hypothetical protein
MIRASVIAGVILSTTSWTPVSAASRDPLGERAPYQLDKARARTTSMIESGSAEAIVTEYLPNHERGPSYNIDLNYDFVVQFYGHQKGTSKWVFAKEFFEPAFMANLRATGSYITPDYKIRHEGYADAQNKDGILYPHCDVILIYDVVIPEEKNAISSILEAAAGMNPNAKDNPQIEDLKIRAHIFAATPVLGAVKLDLSGVTQGMSVKAGFDYHKAAN